MPNHMDDVLLHAMDGSELSRVRTELRLLPPEPIHQVCSVEGNRHCYAIKCFRMLASAPPSAQLPLGGYLGIESPQFGPTVVGGQNEK
jgi:hypothetical protein